MAQKFLEQTQTHAIRIMEVETIQKNAASPKSQTIRGNILKIFSTIVIFCFCVNTLFGQDDDGGLSGAGLSASLGYVPNQDIAQDINGVQYVSHNGNTMCFDISGYAFWGERISFAVAWGLGIRSYNLSNMYTDEANPYKERKTRFDIHIGPGFKLDLIPNGLSVCSTFQPFLWYGGMTDEGPTIEVGTGVTTDLVIANRVSIGISYRLASTSITTTQWSMNYDSNMYYFIKPALEFKISLFLLSGSGDD